MGQVFKARHRLMERVVALKMIRPDRVQTRPPCVGFDRKSRPRPG